MKFSLILIAFILNTSCVDHNLKTEVKENDATHNNVTDTLKFTSGLRSILHDHKGNFWFGSDQEGVCMYDGKTFTYYTTANGFCGKQVIQIQEDERGVVWFGTSSGLCYYDGFKFISESQQYENSSWAINSTDIWFPGNNNKLLIRIDQGKTYGIKNPMAIPSGGNPNDNGITGFSKGHKGDLWIACYNGVAHYDGKTIEYINDETMHFDGKTMYMHVRSILEDSKGRLWIGNNGIGVQLKEKNSISHFSKEFNLFKGNIFGTQSPSGTLMHVFAIKEDSKGNIWFGDRDTGVWRYDGNEIKNFTLDPNLRTQHIWDIYEDNNGDLLFASADRGIYKFNGNGFDRFL